jgi:hypothetical protein
MRPLVIAAAMVFAPAFALEQRTSCPLALPAEAVTVRAPTGWTGYTPSFVRLTGFGMMAGPPESMTYLVPSGSRKLKGGAATNWQFGGGDEKWLYCTYDSSAAIQISRRVDDAAKVCELSHTKDAYGNISEMRVACR